MLLARRWSLFPSLLLALCWLVSANEPDRSGTYIRYGQHSFNSSRRPPYSTRPPPTENATLPPRLRLQVCPTPNTILNFANAGLKRIGDAFVRSSETRKLYLNDNEITEVSALAFEELTQLEFLDLSGNNISVKKLLWFNGHQSLRNLIINDNKYIADESSIDNIFHALPRLEELSLRRGNIYKLNVNLTKFAPRLARLDLSGNKIASVDFLFDLPRTLFHLSLDDNAIARIDDDTLSNVKELSVSGNELEELCSTSCQTNWLSLGGMTRLSNLNVSRNRIGSVATNAFVDTRQLTVLDLSSNVIKKLPDSISSGLVPIRELYLAHNELTSLPNVCNLLQLRHLDLSYNHIAEVTSANFCVLHYLETLLLSNNHILNIDSEAFASLPVLHILDLSSNVIDELPVNLIARADRLRVLSLKNNSIRNIDNLFREGAGSLEELHIEGNPFPCFKVMHMPNLTIHVKEPILYSMDGDAMEQSGEKDDSQEENEVESSSFY